VAQIQKPISARYSKFDGSDGFVSQCPGFLSGMIETPCVMGSLHGTGTQPGLVRANNGPSAKQRAQNQRSQRHRPRANIDEAIHKVHRKLRHMQKFL
jgi:hypothetical protein